MVDRAKYVRKCLRITSPPCHNEEVFARALTYCTRSVASRALVALLLVSAFTLPTPVRAHPAPRLIGTNGQGTLLFIGDSLTVGSDAFGSLARRARDSLIWTKVIMDARVGRTASTGATSLRTRRTSHTTAIVIALGTNDMISKSQSWYPSWVIDKVMVESRGLPVLWFTLEFSATGRSDWRLRASRFNKALRTAQAKWPNLMIADWNSHFVPNRVSRFIADGVHLTVNGYRTRANFSVKQLLQFGDTIVNASTTTTSTTTSTTTTTTTTTLPPDTTTTSSTSTTTTTATTTPSPPTT